MPMNPVKPGLRTIHNGSNSVTKAQINVPVGGELTVPEVVAVQLMHDASFKDGPATDAIKALAALLDAPPVELVLEPEPSKTSAKTKKSQS